MLNADEIKVGTIIKTAGYVFDISFLILSIDVINDDLFIGSVYSFYSKNIIKNRTQYYDSWKHVC